MDKVCAQTIWGVRRWTPGAGGGKANNCYTKLCEARGDLYPMVFFAVVITGKTCSVPCIPGCCSRLLCCILGC